MLCYWNAHLKEIRSNSFLTVIFDTLVIVQIFAALGLGQRSSATSRWQRKTNHDDVLVPLFFR